MNPTGQLPSKILVVDSDPMIGRICQNQLKRYNVSVLTAQDLNTALYHFNQNRLDVVLIEMNFRDLSGLVMIQKWREHRFVEKRYTGFVCLVNRDLDANQSRLVNELGDIELSRKPISEPKLIPILTRALATKLNASSRPLTLSKKLQTLNECNSDPELTELVKVMLQQSDTGSKRFVLQYLYESLNCQKYLPAVLDLLSEDPSNSLLQHSAGKLYEKSGRSDLASKCLELADQLAPKNIGRIADMASVYLKMREPVKASKKFRELVDLSPEQPELKYSAMKYILDAGFQKTASDFGEQCDPPADVMKHYNNKGVTLSKEGKYEEALLEYENAIRLLPESKKNSMIYYNMALAYLKTTRSGKLDVAVSCLNKSLQIDPNFEKAKIKLVELKTKHLNNPMTND